MSKAISRALLGKIVDDVFGGAIEDSSVIEEIYAVIKREEAAIGNADPVAWLRHGEETFVQNVPFGAMWISNKDDPRAFPVYDRPEDLSPSMTVKALDDLTLPIAGTLFVARGAASARAYQEIVADGDGYFNLAKIDDVAKALEPFRSALSAQVQDVVGTSAADQIIGQIEEIFPNWPKYRDLVDCIICELHELRQRAEGQNNG
ncbi:MULTISPECIES: hypothetical protein [Rhizobium/Agrobacterium group]|uniref:Uncharacterized protein n=1 Tax=Rhizobium rhizogenes TaxID=359 RepID=A0A546XI54_RHIRH|nr:MULTISPECIES: hypothetical protein [Rhizobium/Agrobacterium group]TRB00434.1 hypothetical protein EXN68_12005 [Rhizobium rhizogenes]